MSYKKVIKYDNFRQEKSSAFKDKLSFSKGDFTFSLDAFNNRSFCRSWHQQ